MRNPLPFKLFTLRDRPLRASVPLIVCVLLLQAGCRRPIDTDKEIQRLAVSWPPYQTPAMGELAPPGMWTPMRTPTRRGPRPVLEGTPPLLKSYREWSLEETALDALARIGAPAVPELIQSLRHPDPRIRLQAAEVIGRIGPVADQAVDALIQTVNHESEEEVRKAAVRALGQIGPNAETAVDSLIGLLRGSEQ